MQARTKLVASIATMATMFVVSSAARASVIAFENPPGPGHFVWYGGSSSSPIGLNILLDAASQSGANTGSSVFRQANLTNGQGYVNTDGSGQRMETGGPSNGFLIPLDMGSGIPSGANWGTTGYVYHPSLGSQLDLDTAQFIGVRIPNGADFQYGWIQVVRFELNRLDVLAWGYETEPGVPIAAGAGIPEPATLSLLLIGAVVIVGRRRTR